MENGILNSTPTSKRVTLKAISYYNIKKVKVIMFLLDSEDHEISFRRGYCTSENNKLVTLLIVILLEDRYTVWKTNSPKGLLVNSEHDIKRDLSLRVPGAFNCRP